MGILNACFLLLSVFRGARAYAQHEAVLPLMSDDRLYNSKPAPASPPPAAVSNGLDMTVTGTGQF